MTAADIINRLHERLDGSKLISVYGQTVEFKWSARFFRVWTNMADELEVRCIDPTYNYQMGDETEYSKHVKETLER